MRSTYPLPHALPGERRVLESPAGELSYYVAGPAGGSAAEQAPLLLLHSINAAASAAEVGPVYKRALNSRRVYAPDLPGFGFSERSERRYDVALYVAAIEALLEEIQRLEGQRSVDALALSLSNEFLARAALAHPEQLRSLTLVSPTGMRGRDRSRGSGTREQPWLAALFERTPLGSWLFDRLTRPDVIRYFLRRTFGSRDIDGELWRYAVLTANQPNAYRAPLAFLCGRLFSRDARSLYGELEMPVWLCHGVRGDFTDYGGSASLVERDNWQRTVMQTGALPFFEQPDEFQESLDAFLNGHR